MTSKTRGDVKYVTWQAFLRILIMLGFGVISAFGFTLNQVGTKADKSDMCYIRSRVDQIYNLMLRKRGEDQ